MGSSRGLGIYLMGFLVLAPSSSPPVVATNIGGGGGERTRMDDNTNNSDELIRRGEEGAHCIVAVANEEGGTMEIYLQPTTTTIRRGDDPPPVPPALLERIERLIRIQVMEVIEDAAQGSACVSRLIDQRLAQLRQKEDEEEEEDLLRRSVVCIMHEGFFDAYRIASDQRAHHLDPRMWAMPPHALAAARREHREICRRLNRSTKERQRLSQRIGHFQNVLETTRTVLQRLYGDVMMNAEMLELTLGDREAELRSMEDREVELIRSIDELQSSAQQLCMLLQRQTLIACFEQVRRSEEEQEQRQQQGHDKDKDDDDDNNKKNVEDEEERRPTSGKRKRRRIMLAVAAANDDDEEEEDLHV